MSRKTMVTTLDNPYNPFTQFDEWFAFDESKGYHTCSYLARIARTANDLPVIDEDLEIEHAVDEIVELNLTGNYKKVVKV